MCTVTGGGTSKIDGLFLKGTEGECGEDGGGLEGWMDGGCGVVA